MYSRLLSRPSRQKAIPFERLRCRRQLIGHRPEPFREVSLLTVATGALVKPMTRNGVRRLVCISALGVGNSRGHGGFVLDRLFLPLLRSHAYKDQDGQCELSRWRWRFLDQRFSFVTNGLEEPQHDLYDHHHTDGRVLRDGQLERFRIAESHQRQL